MNLLSLKRALAEFVRVLWRNRWISIGTVVSMAMVFFLTWMVLSVSDSSQRIIDRVEKKIDIGVFFQKDLPKIQTDAFLSELDRMAEDGKIKSYTFFSKEYALEEMKKKFPEKVRFLERYEFKNPLQDSVEIIPGLMGPDEIFEFLHQDKFQTVIDYEFFDSYEQKKEEVNRMLRLLSFFRKGGFVLVTVFLAICAFLIGFFVSSLLHQKKREIFIMRLVGASHWFIRLPFILEGVVLAMISYIFSFLIFSIFLDRIAPSAINFFPSSSDQVFMSDLIFELQDEFMGMFWLIFMLLLVSSSVIAFGAIERFIGKRHLLDED